MGLFSKEPKQPKTAMDLLEEQLKFWRSNINDNYNRGTAKERIIELENHLMKLTAEQIPQRIKAIEDTIAEILLMGKEGE